MSFADRARNARQHKSQKCKWNTLKAGKARKCKVKSTVGNNTALVIANQAKLIKKLKAEIAILKTQVTKLTNNRADNVRNQSTVDQLSSILADIKQIMPNIHVPQHGCSYNRYLCSSTWHIICL